MKRNTGLKWVKLSYVPQIKRIIRQQFPKGSLGQHQGMSTRE